LFSLNQELGNSHHLAVERMFVRIFVAHGEKWDHSTNATDKSTGEGSRYLKLAAHIGLKLF
jgi:hypothetical protein